MNYYNEIRNKLIDNEIYRRVKDYSKERNRVKTYFEIGKLLNEAGSHQLEVDEVTVGFEICPRLKSISEALKQF